MVLNFTTEIEILLNDQNKIVRKRKLFFFNFSLCNLYYKGDLQRNK
jgi:hypothetical protein